MVVWGGRRSRRSVGSYSFWGRRLLGWLAAKVLLAGGILAGIESVGACAQVKRIASLEYGQWDELDELVTNWVRSSHLRLH